MSVNRILIFFVVVVLISSCSDRHITDFVDPNQDFRISLNKDVAIVNPVSLKLSKIPSLLPIEKDEEVVINFEYSTNLHLYPDSNALYFGEGFDSIILSHETWTEVQKKMLFSGKMSLYTVSQGVYLLEGVVVEEDGNRISHFSTDTVPNVNVSTGDTSYSLVSVPVQGSTNSVFTSDTPLPNGSYRVRIEKKVFCYECIPVDPITIFYSSDFVIDR